VLSVRTGELAVSAREGGDLGMSARKKEDHLWSDVDDGKMESAVVSCNGHRDDVDRVRRA
jgi:hypothetical protein